jgi:hypothetical protein
MSALQLVAVLGAGLLAGIINTIVGAGTLVTFPLLLAVGIPPIVANVSNTVGLVPAAVTGAWGYRRELAGQWPTVIRMALLSAVGGVIGAGLLLVAPAETFTSVVPWLLVLAAGLAAAQPRVTEALRRRENLAALSAGMSLTEPPPAELVDRITRPLSFGLLVGVAATGVYGGYFGAAQGVILLTMLGIWWSADLHRANGAKVVLAGTANLVSAGIFAFSGHVDWRIAALIAVGSALGGVIGANVARRIPAPALRVVIVVVGLAAAVALWVRG